VCNDAGGRSKRVLREAVPTRGSTKYSGEAGAKLRWKARSEKEGVQAQLLGSLALTKSTWKNYSTAEGLLRKCCREKGIEWELPVRDSTVISFVLWLAFDRGVSSATISNYLSGVRNLHVVNNVVCPELRSEQVELLLKGKKNWEQAVKREAGVSNRRPVTPDILRLLKARISDSDLLLIDKKMVWTVCTVLFFGAFRGHELLCKGESTFDPAFTLLFEDVKIRREAGSDEKWLEFKIKAPKEDKAGKVTVVDVYQSVPELCPVRAFVRWREAGPPAVNGQPLFRWAEGKPLTAAALNRLLKERLEGFVEGAGKWFTTHSFRTGAASWLGAVGVEDAEVQALGRWSSRAFEEYLRLPRTKRKVVARALGQLVE
jgi:integrase